MTSGDGGVGGGGAGRKYGDTPSTILRIQHGLVLWVIFVSQHQYPHPVLPTELKSK